MDTPPLPPRTIRLGQPTAVGWLAIAAAVVSFSAGWVFGVVELSVVGSGLVLLVGLAVARVSIGVAGLDVRRAVPSHRIHARDQIRIELHLTNRNRFPTPLLRLHEPVSGSPGATVLSPPVAAQTAEHATYRVATERRGLLRIGPTELVLFDPFGLAENRWVMSEQIDLIVRPAIDDVAAPFGAAGDHPMAQQTVRRHLPSPGQEFRALREFAPGDELRRVHWAASARRDELLVHESEVLEDRRTTVVLDLSESATEQAFESAVSAAASVLDAVHAAGGQIRLMTTGGYDSGTGPGRLDAIMTELAFVEPDDTTSVPAIIQRLGAERSTMIVVTGSYDPAVFATTLALVGAGAGWLIITEEDSTAPRGSRIVATAAEGLTGPWRSAMSRAGPR